MDRDNKQGVPGILKTQKLFMHFGRYIAIVCMLVLAGSLFAGCSTNSNPQPQPQPESNKPSENTQTDTTGSTSTTTENAQPKKAIASRVEGNVQYVTSSLTRYGYDSILVQQGVPVVWTLKAPGDELTANNSSIVIHEYGIEMVLVAGDNLIEFTPDKAGTFVFSSSTDMLYSYISVADEKGNVPEVDWSTLPKVPDEGCSG